MLNQPVTFKVRAYDPDGDTLTYTWKQDGIVVKAGKDSSYTTTFGGKYGDPHLVMCIVSDPGGLHADTTWNFTLTPVESIEGSIPGQFALSQNYPNPFNPSTRIEFDLPVTRVVSLEVFDVAGIRIRILLENQRADAGRHEVVWNGLDGNGKQVPSGIYLYRLRTADRSFVRKMTLLK